jgi:molybdate transport system permease protein
LAFTTAAAVIASAVMGFPLMVRAVRLSFEHVDRGLEEVAHTLGASPARVFATVTLPLALPGILTGAMLAFARSLGEFGATIAFAGNIPGETRTVPLAVFGHMLSPGGEASAARLVVLSILLSVGALLASEVLARRARRRVGLDT